MGAGDPLTDVNNTVGSNGSVLAKPFIITDDRVSRYVICPILWNIVNEACWQTPCESVYERLGIFPASVSRMYFVSVACSVYQYIKLSCKCELRDAIASQDVTHIANLSASHVKIAAKRYISHIKRVCDRPRRPARPSAPPPGDQQPPPSPLDPDAHIFSMTMMG